MIRENEMDREQILQRLAALHLKIAETGDVINARKVLDLLRKVNDEEYLIGFFGHFSAGKSSLLNHLFGTEVLPTSPIPTSANVVKLSTGDPKAYITLSDGNVIELTPPLNMKNLQQYCTDGEHIQLVEIQQPNDQILTGVALFDTPGIDSTDTAHRLATESILHLADALFYVMDYNHVLSELNFTFAKMLQERGLTIYLIVNQIDKHQDRESSFEQYKEDIFRALERWDIRPAGIFFTSVHHPHFPNNELQKLENHLQIMMENRHTSIHDHVYRAARYILHEHVKWLEEQDEQSIEEDGTVLTEDEIIQYEQKYHTLLAKKAKLETVSNRFSEEAQQGLQKILHNSSLMPYETRELAKAYLESTQSNFKVGFFSSRKKTEEERDRRLQAFFEDVKGKIRAQLDWHIISYFQQQSEQLSIHKPELLATIQNFEVKVDEQIFVQTVKKDAHLSGDYLLNYTKEVAETIKQLYRKHAMQLIESMKHAIDQQNEGQLQEIEENIKQIAPVMQMIQSMREAEQRRQKRIEHLQELLLGNIDDRTLQLANDLLQQQRINAKQATISTSEPTIKLNPFAEEVFDVSHDTSREVMQATEAIDQSNRSEYLTHAVHSLMDVSSIIEGLKGFYEDAKQLREKANRIADRRFTIALFGAFSAGKSSFANALMGAQLLPTSPNPTTAAITKIHPSTTQYPHGTIRVKIKSEQRLLDEANYLLQSVQQKAENVVEALELLDKLQENNTSNPYSAFITALQSGYLKFVEQLNTVIEGNVADLPKYAAVEENAVFVEWIEIYYDSVLTKQGISLVDTPGADSIHARHTGVAFDYIKNADAIVYITYYNHAFSQADQLFLQQLGRVKDAFELDKMFFIINAADLAKSDDELHLVKQHIQKNLRANGVQNARIYTVSSKKALEAKIASDATSEKLLQESHFPIFEYDFHAFMIQDLVQNVSRSVELDIERILHKLDVYISSAQQSAEDRAVKLQQMIETHSQLLDKIQKWDPSHYERNVHQEVNELLYYVLQRLQLKLRDYFKISFSPAVLRKDVKDIKQALRNALIEWIQLIEQNLMQELQATSLRIEKNIRQQMKQMSQGLIEQLMAMDGEIRLSSYSVDTIESVQVKNVSLHLDVHSLYPFLSSFKNQRQFFEEGGNQSMLDNLSKSLQSPLSLSIEQWKENFTNYYAHVFKQLYDELIKHLCKQVDEHYIGQKEILSAPIHIDLYKNAYHQLNQLTLTKDRVGLMSS